MILMENGTLNFTEILIAELGSGKVLTGDDISSDFRHDECRGVSGTPDAVVLAADTADVSAVMKLCCEHNVPVTVRGAGTGQAGGAVPVNGGIVLSLINMNKILGADEAAQCICVQPGVLLGQLKDEAERHGLYYPPDPGEKTATVGGNAATNASGPCAAKYGKTRDYVLDAVIVLSDGTTARLSENAGLGCVLGSEGTLGVITELTLRLIKKPAAETMLLFPFLDTESCISAAVRIADEGFAPAAVEYMDTDMVEFSAKVTGEPVFPVSIDGERCAATLMVTLVGDDEDAVMEMLERIAELGEELECMDILVGDTPVMMREFTAAHDAFHTSVESGAAHSAEYNIAVPTSRMAEMIGFAKASGEKLGLRSCAMRTPAAAACTSTPWLTTILPSGRQRLPTRSTQNAEHSAAMSGASTA